MLLSGTPVCGWLNFAIIRLLAPMDHYNRVNPTLNLINLNAIRHRQIAGCGGCHSNVPS